MYCLSETDKHIQMLWREFEARDKSLQPTPSIVCETYTIKSMSLQPTPSKVSNYNLHHQKVVFTTYTIKSIGIQPTPTDPWVIPFMGQMTHGSIHSWVK